MPRLLPSLLLVVLAWAAIYLPGLGLRELEGEEARRVLPGRTMIQNGDWILPRSAGRIYNRKPPGINWAIAAAIKLRGKMDEFTVRLPSTLGMLALALVMAVMLRDFLGRDGALLAALITLTSIGFIEKGRMAEIDGLYCACFGLALTTWLALWWRGRILAAWCAAGLALGLGFLVKGPPHVWYFYALIIAALRQEGRLKELLSWRHGAGLLLFFATWSWWALQNSGSNPQGDSGAVWISQITHRLGFTEFEFTNWLLQIPFSIASFLPWALLLPLVWRCGADNGDASAEAERRRRILAGLAQGLLIAFFVIALLPSSRPRFMLPLNAAAAILVVGALWRLVADHREQISRRWRASLGLLAWLLWLALLVGPWLVAWRSAHTVPVIPWLTAVAAGLTFLLALRAPVVQRRLSSLPLTRMGVHTALLAALAMWAFNLFWQQSFRKQVLSAFAVEIRSHIGADTDIILFRTEERMWPFYLGLNCREVVKTTDLPPNVRWVLTPAEDKAENALVLEPRCGRPVKEIPLKEPLTDDAGGKGEEYVLWELRKE